LESAHANAFSACRNQGWAQTREAGNRGFQEPGSDSMMPRDRLTAKEIKIADLVWQGLANREIGKSSAQQSK
jgi:DNA-binding NarL/FixJ family response regulator